MRDQESRKMLLSICLQMCQSAEIELLISGRLEEEKARKVRLIASEPGSEAAQHAESLVDCLQELLEEAEIMTDETSSLLTHVLSQLPPRDTWKPQKNPCGTKSPCQTGSFAV